MKNPRIKLVIIAAFLAVSISVMGGCNPNNSLTASNMSKKTTLSQAIDISKKELTDKGFDVKNMNINGDEKNTAWQEFSSTPGSTTLQTPLVKKMDLGKKDYWAIYFAPRKQMLGGDAWVFIDKNSGETIGTIFG